MLQTYNTNYMKRLICFAVATLTGVLASGQPRYDMENIQKEKLDRGVVAIRQDASNVVVSWRTLASDKKGEAFDIYRNGEKLNAKPLTAGGTFFVDNKPLDGDATYEIRGGGNNGKFTLKAGAPDGYLPIQLNKPEGGYTPDGRQFTYSANDASVGDVDGDGRYEIIVKWDPANAHDTAHAGFTGNTLFDCYTLDGKQLWRIDLGRNIRSGAHYVPFIVYDLDGDGRAELMVKTADGTVDGLGNIIGDETADWRSGATEAMKTFEQNKVTAKKEQEERERRRKEWEQRRQQMGDRQGNGQWQGRRGGQGQMQRNGQRPNRQMGNRRPGQNRGGQNRPAWNNSLTGRIMDGPEYITVFNGLTGAAMDTKPYNPERGTGDLWGDNHGNRSERYLAGVGYFDGKRATAFFCRGYYTRTVIAAWNWDGRTLSQPWTFDTMNEEWKDWGGQGFHNLRVGDVDGDGCDEIVYGSMVVDNNGKGLYNTRMGHGDAMHLTVFDPKSDKLQVWTCHENRRDGSVLRDAATGEKIFQVKSRQDVGRAMASDIDPTNPGLEMWTLDSKGIRTLNGKVLTNKARMSTNFAVWWDGDLLRELLDHNAVSKYSWKTQEVERIVSFDGAAFNNGSKSNPCLSGDIIGDWREEVLVRSTDSKELRLYVSPIPTDYRINCLMQDIVYRLSIATENVGYNQPPHTGFYLGPDKTDYLK